MAFRAGGFQSGVLRCGFPAAVAVGCGIGQVTGTHNNGRLRRIADRRVVRQQLRRRRFGTRADARSNRQERLSLLILSLPGLAAFAALLFTWIQVNQTSRELQISEQGQVTSRFNTAVVNLASDSIDLRLAAIYALERIMHDSPRDQPTIVSLLSAYARRRAPAPTSTTSATGPPSADIEAVMNALAGRLPVHDKGVTINLSQTILSGWSRPSSRPPVTGVNLDSANLAGTDFSGAVLADAQLRKAFLSGANLYHTDLLGADLSKATLTGADLREAVLFEANLTDAWFCGGDRRRGPDPGPCPDMTGAKLHNANLTRAVLVGANLAKHKFCAGPYWEETETGMHRRPGGCARLTDADLSRANLSGAGLAGVDLSNADLTGADLSKANLSKANLSGAVLTGAKLDGARLDGARGLPPSLLRERGRQDNSPPG
ncbi:pentapeptide repeat-containing protein [Streptomyces sp. NPDC091273]|uniref:pentapeptide repeat-containing protein n=1 Tax=Streptomyces sp. NPDC091273 TaxID=3365982 RepID=UPI0038295CBE